MGHRDRRSIAELNGAERLMVENLIAWRIMACAGVAMIIARVLLHSFETLGLAHLAVQVATFLTMNLAFFAVCARWWVAAHLPFAPAGWRHGRRARIATMILVIHASAWSLMPIDVQLMLAFTLAWLRLYV